MEHRSELRNIAIIAHVDHGKTTLVDGMLKQGNVFRANQDMGERIMDRFDLERERGITIVSKNTAITYRGIKINIVDTPGHADFGGEVERVLNMVDGVLLLVDAVDGPMPQTKFVLSKALALGLRAIVVINKVDRADARPDWVLDATFDLFVSLNASEEQLDFPIVYANALAGTAALDTARPGEDLRPLFDTILQQVPAPRVDRDAPAQMLVTSLDYDDYRGRIAVGRVFAGTLRPHSMVVHIDRQGVHRPARVAQLYVYDGLRRVEVPEAVAGEIVAITGIPEIHVGETVACAVNPTAIPPTVIDEPTLRMTFSVNNSPLAGREGQYCTSPHLRNRLMRELESNVSLRLEETDSPDAWLVSGRGELHLAILIETMRREGYELQVSQPEVIYRSVEGRRCEPMELLTVDVPEEYVGAAVEQLGRRRGEMKDMVYRENGDVHLEFLIPTRGLIGFRTDFMSLTKGTAVVHSLFAGYAPTAGEIAGARSGSLVATEGGVSSSFGLSNAEARGALFIGPGVEVYEGMVVGQHCRDEDLDVNVCKRKHLTNMRSSTADEAIRLTTPVEMSLDRALEYISADELVEVTPKSIRLRKRLLDGKMRARAAKSARDRPEALAVG
jgi:GTP-binding protein